MTAKIESSNKEVIFSGSFITFSKGDNTISFDYGGEKFKFILSFSTDDSKKPRFEYAPNDKKDTLLMKFYNFENSLGTGSTAPLEVAENKGSKIYLHLIVYSLNENIKNVSYTFYIDK